MMKKWKISRRTKKNNREDKKKTKTRYNSNN